MDEKRIQCLSNASSMYPSIINRFPVIQPVSSKVRHFSTFLHILASPGYAPGTIAINVTRLERGFNACTTPRCIYPSIFNRLRAIARYWSEIATFSYLLAFNSPVGGVPVGIPGKRLNLKILESWQWRQFEDRLSHNTSVWRTDSQTDGQTSSL